MAAAAAAAFTGQGGVAGEADADGADAGARAAALAAAAGSGKAAAKDGALPPREVKMIGDIRQEIWYERLDDGRLAQHIREVRVETRRTMTTKAIQERRKWKKFGAAAGAPPGPEARTTSIADEVYLELSSKKETAPKLADEIKKKMQRISCRICGGDHFTNHCPMKATLSEAELAAIDSSGFAGRGGEGAKEAMPTPAEANAPTPGGGGPGRYVAPNRRVASAGGTPHRGETMDRGEDFCSIKITNLAEDTVEDDVRDLCKPFGVPTRVHLARDSRTNRVLGFAYVTFLRRESAENAKQRLEGHPFNSLILHVETAKSKRERD